MCASGHFKSLDNLVDIVVDTSNVYTVAWINPFDKDVPLGKSFMYCVMDYSMFML